MEPIFLFGWMDESDMLSIWLDGVIFFGWMRVDVMRIVE
jgi:hypothetical protein